MASPDELCHLVEVEDPADNGATVEVPLPLSTDAAQVIVFLTGAKLHYRTWLDVALFFQSHGHSDKYVDILTEAVKRMRAKPPATYLERDQRCEACASFAGYHLQCLAEDPSDQHAREMFSSLFALAQENDKSNPAVNVLECAYALFEIGSSKKLSASEREAKYEALSKRLARQANACKTYTQRIQLAIMNSICTYRQENYIDAWKQFAQVVTLTPNKTPNGVRLGLAYCNYKLGQEEAAIKTFKRAIDVDPTHTRALVGLAGILLSSQGGNARARQKDGSGYTYKAFHTVQNQPNHSSYPLVMNMFVTNLFRDFYADPVGKQKHAKTIEEVVKSVLHSVGSEVDEDRSNKVKSEAHYQLGRLAHVQADYDKAESNYKLALHHDSNHIPALYSRAQCLIYLRLKARAHNEQATARDVEEIIGLLKRCHNLCPDNSDLLGIMANLQAWKYRVIRDHGMREEALHESLTLLHNITDVANPQDTEAWALRGFMERVDGMEATACYERQIAVLNESSLPVPASLLTNLAALHIQSGNVVKAADKLAQAHESLTKEQADGAHDEDALQTMRTILSYNTALLEEKKQNLESAAQKHIDIIKTWPGFLDSYLALIDIYHELGHRKKAYFMASLAQEVMRAKPLTLSALPRIQVAALLFRMGYHREAVSQAQELSVQLADEQRSTVATDETLQDLLNLSLLVEANGRYAYSSQGSTSSEKRRDELAKAERIYKRVYESDRDNAYAVHNLACTLVSQSKNHLAKAKSLLERVKEATVPSGSGLDNVAAFNLAQISFYERIPTKCLPLYLALQGKLENEPALDTLLSAQDICSKVAHCHVFQNDFRTAMRGFTHVTEETPSSVTASCNLVLATLGSVLQEFREDLLTTEDAIETAEGLLQNAAATLERLVGEMQDAMNTEGITAVKRAECKTFSEQIKKYSSMCAEVTRLVGEEKTAVREAETVRAAAAATFADARETLVTDLEQERRKRHEDELEKRRLLNERLSQIIPPELDFVTSSSAAAAAAPARNASAADAVTSAMAEMEAAALAGATHHEQSFVSGSGRRIIDRALTAEDKRDVEGESSGEDTDFKADDEDDENFDESLSDTDDELPTKRRKRSSKKRRLEGGDDAAPSAKRSKKEKKSKKSKKAKKEDPPTGAFDVPPTPAAAADATAADEGFEATLNTGSFEDEEQA
eukprot:Rhum_TRINITY_DN8856_c0_g1::Rhum_TRINITY_DN8856_c0_g1_i1::g.30298::m.30298/K15176/CTR9; RNA polymerase-associated protein CTR9